MTVQIKYNIKAYEQMRRLPETTRALDAMAGAIADACGDGYEAKSGAGKTRDRAAVLTVTAEAMADNAAHQTLLNNLDKGKL